MHTIRWFLITSLIAVICKSQSNNKEDIDFFKKLKALFNNAVYEKHQVHPYIQFDKNYNTKKMPLKKLPLDVNITINIKNIYAVDEVNQLLGMETTVQMNWIDDRITLLNVSKEHLNSDRITLPPNVSTEQIIIKHNCPIINGIIVPTGICVSGGRTLLGSRYFYKWC